MASFTRSFFFITIILSTLLLSTQIHARESYFFHKFQRDNAQDKNHNQKTSGEEVLPKKEQEPQDSDPRFVPESDNGYGLYGHETSSNNNNKKEFNKSYQDNVKYEPYNTPSLSQTEESYNYDKYSKDNENYNKKKNEDNDKYEPYNTPSLSQTEESYNYDNKQNEDNVKYGPYKTPSLSESESYNYDKYSKDTDNKQYEDNVKYEPYNTPSLGETEESYSYDKYSKEKENTNNNNEIDKNYYNSNAYGRERSYNGYTNNVERQGMSDTRFMENGKYYFDVDDDKNHGDLYKKHYRQNPSYAVSNYDRFGQNGNNEQNSFQDPYNSKWEKNMVSQQEQEEEFGEEQQDQFVP